MKLPFTVAYRRLILLTLTLVSLGAVLVGRDDAFRPWFIFSMLVFMIVAFVHEAAFGTDPVALPREKGPTLEDAIALVDELAAEVRKMNEAHGFRPVPETRAYSNEPSKLPESFPTYTVVKRNRDEDPEARMRKEREDAAHVYAEKMREQMAGGGPLDPRAESGAPAYPVPEPSTTPEAAMLAKETKASLMDELIEARKSTAKFFTNPFAKEALYRFQCIDGSSGEMWLMPNESLQVPMGTFTTYLQQRG